MKKIYLPVCFAVVISACNTQSAQTPAAATPGPPLIENMEGCYLMKIDKDSATMQLAASGADSYSGTMNYRPTATAPHSGNVILKSEEDYVTGWYTSVNFEGKTTVTQKIFKPTVNGLTEGVGEMENRNDTAFFMYPHNLRFEENFPFMKKPCN